MNKENNIDIPTPNDDPIQLMIEKYKTDITETQLKDEVYKWRLIEKFRGRPNLDAEDFHKEIKSIDYSNLIYHLSKAVINELAEANPDEIRKLFAELFDESVDLTNRVKAFTEQTKMLYKGLGKTNSHHQDERAISAYLTYKYPEKYTLYKYSFYRYYCVLRGVDEAKKNERYSHYLSLIDELIEQYIAPDVKLIDQVKSYLPEHYDGVNHKLLAQDILFQMENVNARVNYWVFQGNPKQFDFEVAMEQDAIETWTVTAHKNKIKEGDKVVLWLTGEEAGCYALAEVTSKPYERTTAPDDEYWLEANKNSTVVDIDITHNLMDNPLLKDDIVAEKELANLKVGNQGTNFSATKEEYEAILGLIVKTEKGMGINQINHPLNTIFYGPPGTGKTYNTVLRAAEIVEGRKIKDYKEALQIFNANLHNQIEFITFHQNYSYEDFIQGLRPDIGNEKELTFHKNDGVFKVISDKALQNHLNADNKKEVKKNYVIIIDEINRANISRVFGELITLIEPDKRSHGEIPLVAQLPSGDKFMVPSSRSAHKEKAKGAAGATPALGICPFVSFLYFL